MKNPDLLLGMLVGFVLCIFVVLGAISLHSAYTLQSDVQRVEQETRPHYNVFDAWMCKPAAKTRVALEAEGYAVEVMTWGQEPEPVPADMEPYVTSLGYVKYADESRVIIFAGALDSTDHTC